MTFANHWMHGGMLQINGEKMSKSLNNFFLLRDILETVDPSVLRFLMLQTHYRSPLDFSDERVDEAGVALERIKNAVKALDWALENANAAEDAVDAAAAGDLVRATRAKFIAAMDDDFNSSKALGDVFDFVGEANTIVAGKTLSAADAEAVRPIRDLIIELMGVFGVELRVEAADGGEGGIPNAVAELLAMRTEARAAKDWPRADEARDKLAALGWAVVDTPQGPRLERA